MNLDEFSKKRVLVIGDIMLDKHLHGEVSRISPEAPVPILKVNQETYNPGGAGNLASNLSALGAKVYVGGIVGNDEAQRKLFEIFENNNIDTSCILKSNKPTTQKIRGMSRQHLFRIDYEDTQNIDEQEEEKLLFMIKNKIRDIDAILLSDYNKGTLTENLITNIIKLAKENNKLVTADCKPKNFSFYKDLDLLKPNEKEAFEMAKVSDIEEAGKIISENLNSHVIITRGNEGMSIFERNKIPKHIPARAKQVYDVSGAGDTVLATLTLSLLVGNSLEESAKLANEAASIVVSKPGVVTLTLDELRLALSPSIKTVSKVWGEEQWIENNSKYCGKRLFIKKDHYSSYHMHKNKEETFYVLEGELEIIHNGKHLRLLPEETLKLNTNEYHSFRALQDTTFFEFSTQHTDEDNYRLTKSNKGSHEQWRKEIEEILQNVSQN
ncbi:D-glycero-beta-D-manno-heptose-7-phosphate kinase [Candidatus Woesearchaeota archaeon]|nr:D-glycero-beta-D-manno-heptose-7-phosphate kinase [Candidatus Woesearchaeota archaeon]